MRTCSVPDCGNRHQAHDLCDKHYRKFLRNGDPMGGRPGRGLTVEQRLLRYAIKTDTCWLWQGHVYGKGYGALNVDGTKRYAHRLAYEAWNGPIPDGLFVRHTCDVRRCVNPEHLIVGTIADNNADMAARGRARNGTTAKVVKRR